MADIIKIMNLSVGLPYGHNRVIFHKYSQICILKGQISPQKSNPSTNTSNLSEDLKWLFLFSKGASEHLPCPDARQRSRWGSAVYRFGLPRQIVCVQKT